MIQFKKLLFLSISLLLGVAIFAQNIPPKPSPVKFVNDNAEMLLPAQRDTLESKLKTFSDKTSNQIVILTVNSLYGYGVETYSSKVAQTWGIGQKGQDNGILILVAKNDRKMRIEVGYGLEATITDAYAKQLINTILKPNFKQSKFYTGLHLTSNELIKKISPNYVDKSLEGIAETGNTYNLGNRLTYKDILPTPSKILGLIDSAKIFTTAEVESFNKEIATFEKETSIGIVVVTFPDSLPKNTSLYTYTNVLRKNWLGANFRGRDKKILFLTWQPHKGNTELKLYYYLFDSRKIKDLYEIKSSFRGLSSKKQYKDVLSKVLKTVKKDLKAYQQAELRKEIGRVILTRSLYIYPLLVIVFIILLRIKYRQKITATSKKKKKKQRKKSLKKQKFLLENRFGSWLFLPLFLFHLLLNLILGLGWDIASMIGLFVIDLLVIYLAWSLGTIGLWEMPSGGGGGGGYSGGGSSYSSGSSYSGGSSYSSGGGSSFGGGSFGGGGASGDW